MKKFRWIGLCVLALSLMVSLTACGPLDQVEQAIQNQQALDAYTFDGNLSFETYDEEGQRTHVDSAEIAGSCVRKEAGWLYLWNVTTLNTNTGKTVQTIMRRQYPEETFPKEVDVLGWLPSFSLREDLLDSQFGQNSNNDLLYSVTVKGDQITNDLMDELCEEENLVLDEAKITYQIEINRLSQVMVEYSLNGKNPSTGQYDLLAKKIFLRVTYDEPSEESNIEIPDMSSDVTYE